MTVPSNTATNTYAWLGKFPQMREWVGQRQVEKLSKEAMSLTNKKFEATVAVERTDIEDDQVGMYRPMMAAMGESAAALPDTLVWGLLKKGKTTECYDGQYFFDTDHPVFEKADGTGQNTPAANITTGTDNNVPTWYVIDDTRTVKPLVFQTRTELEFETKFDPSKSDKVFMEDVYVYGARRRCVAGFGLWQLAHMAEKTALNRANLQKIITTMRRLKSNGGYALNIKPSLLVVPPELEDAARELLEAEKINGTTNTFKGRLKLHVSVHL
ncbi:Mu-like prophage major head subunit gpT family protein [Neisseria weaveri]|nr:Mu-like prophage major head subunit gpT family protein [Neisseria weaveri]EGV36382.1 Mu phage protein T [Neisseria weaveri LMG 5135]